MGVHEWWQKYFKWYLALKTSVDVDNTFSNKSSSAVYILLIFFCIGLTISLIAFVLFESHLLKNAFNCLWVTFRLPSEYVSKLPESYVHRQSAISASQQPDKYTCPFCSIKSSSSIFAQIEDLKIHLSNSHPEHFLLNILDTDDNLEALKDLCNTMLTSEITTIVSVDNKNLMQFACPYCSNENVFLLI